MSKLPVLANNLRTLSWLMLLLVCVIARAGAESSGPPDGLRQAAEKGDAAAVAALLAQHPDVDARNADGETALMLAAQSGHVAVVESLLAAGADVNALNKYHQTALIDASDQGQAAVVRRLLEKGATVSVLDTYGMNALLYAARSGDSATAQALLDKGADPSVTANDGSTPLLMAAHVGNADIAKVFLDRGNDVNAAIKSTGITPLIVATAYGHPEVVSLLLSRHADTQKTEKQGHTALFSAVLSHHTDIIPLLKAGGAKPSEADSQALLTVTMNNRPDLAKQLLEIGVDVNYKYSGMTALMLASGLGRTDAEGLPLVQMLLDAGVDVNAATPEGRTALCGAALAGRSATVSLLLAHHADVNTPLTATGLTPLMLAVNRSPFAQQDPADTVRVLLSHGAKVDARDSHGQTALLDTLFERRSDLARLLLTQGASPVAADRDGTTPLMAASEVGLPDVVQLILTEDHTVNQKDKLGRTALARTHGPITMEAVALGPPTPDGSLLSPKSLSGGDADIHEINKGREQCAHLLRAAGGKE